MPKTEPYWNPYRMVPVRDKSPLRSTPCFHDRYQGLAGEIKAELTTLTPFLIATQQGQHKAPVTDNRTYSPIIPGSSLKGMIRSLAELVGNGCEAVSPTKNASGAHAKCTDLNRLCICCRMFGMQEKDASFMGKVLFGEGHWTGAGRKPIMPPKRVLLSTPREHYVSSYPKGKTRKLYHHNPSCLTSPQTAGNQVSEAMVSHIQPIEQGVTFALTVAFNNMSDDELSLLLYCIALEQQVTVEMNGKKQVGDLYHKLGMGKPIGMGSVRIRITQMTLHNFTEEQYRSWERPDPTTFVGDSLAEELASRTDSLRKDNSRTMELLRSMLIWLPDDSRNFHYPGSTWFTGAGRGVDLKDPITGK